jgi:hypothetical protein
MNIPNLNKKHSKAKHSKAKHSKAKHSKAKHSKAKHSKAKHSKAKPKTIQNTIKNYYEITLKVLLDETKLKINKNTLHGTASKKQLESMPWMYCVKPLWSIAPEPYTFDIVFEIENNKVKKTLSIYNGSENILYPSKLVLDVENCNKK